jgi:ppGpp synthetase/RelA/SpoT-type nucleotidyltranferase
MTKFSRKSINRAGEILVSDKATVGERENALQTLNDWRVLHLVPLNTFQITLRNYVKKTSGNDGIVAQRLKRIPTILDKLKRQPQMQLARMQDIGGLRAIVPTVQNVRELEKYYTKYRPKDKSKQHILKRQYDYIIEPKESGYRGIHFVYEYCSPQEEYNSLQIEIQLRSRLQHLWATAVETVGFFVQESLKSSQGGVDGII